MKRLFVILFAIGMVTMSSVSMATMSVSKVRKNTRFLTDRMAHELNLSEAQYNDAYEINFDFIYNVRYIMDDVVNGYNSAMDDYYRYLDVRNDDLRWVLSSNQYRRFLNMEYFYRPIYASGNSWNFRVNVIYNNYNYFYFAKPYHYRTYCGGHYRSHYNDGYYRNRYHHDIYDGHYSTKRESIYQNNRRSDFGTVSARPEARPSSSRNEDKQTTRPSSSRPSSSGNSSGSNSSRPSSGSSSSSTGTTTRPSSSRPATNSSSNSSEGKSNSSRSSSSRSSSGSKVSSGSESRNNSNSSTRSSSSSSSSSSSRSGSSRK